MKEKLRPNTKVKTYSVRDNGAILRHPKNENRVRPLDNIWTFGNYLNEYIISDFYYNNQTESLTVATTTEGGIKSLYLTTVTKHNNHFKYETRSFFDPNGIEKYMTLAKGLEWTGGDVFDDYC